MASTELETIPTAWSNENDGAYFRIVAHLFPAAFLAGATVLLASYDPDDEMQWQSGDFAAPRAAAPSADVASVVQLS